MSRNQAAVAHRRMASMPPLDLFLFMIFIASSVVFNMMFFPGSQLSQEELISAPRVTNAAVYDKTAVHRLVRMVYGEAGVALIAQQSFLEQNILIKNAMSTLNEYFFLNLSIPEDITPFLNEYVPNPIIHLALFGNGDTTTHVEWVLRELIYDQVLRIPQDLPLTTLFGSGFFPKDSTLSVTAQLVHGNVTKQIAVNHATNTLTEELYLANKVESQMIPWVEENWKQVLDEYIHDRTGIEVGGPTPGLFGDIYSASKTFDLVNFAAKTLWGNIEDGGTHSLHGGHGKTFIRDGSTLVGIMDGSYDFTLGAHYLEHLLNPIQAIFTMHRVLKVGGVCVLVLPKKEECFDKMRSIGSIEDMVFRFLHRIPEDDMRYAHVEQVTLQSRLESDFGIPRRNRNYGWFRSRCMMNVENRAIHQFVFDDNVLRKILELMGFTVVFSGNKGGLHQVIVGRKL